LKAAAIDVGTSSIKLCVGEFVPGKGVEILFDSTINARLGEGFAAKHELQPAAIDRAVAALGRLLDAARQLNVDAIRVVGTSAVRDAVNRDILIDRAHSELQADLEVLEGRDEGRLSYTAIALDSVLGEYGGRQAIVDVGGGSTEFIYGNGAQVDSITSVRAGATRLTDRYLQADRPTICEIVDAAVMADHLLQPAVADLNGGRLVGVGGSAVNLCRVHCRVPVDRTDQIHAAKMTYSDIRKVIDLLLARTPDERKELVGLEPERTKTILAGAVILDRILAACGTEEMVVSTRGLRHGLLYEMLANGVLPRE
jgi:exopolyphosphatase/guanosine-5'-triphosphate,3'-diphosphate pyrophosphatase